MGPMIEHARKVMLQFVAPVFCAVLAAGWMMRHPPKLRPNLGISVPFWVAAFILADIAAVAHCHSTFFFFFFAFLDEIFREASSA